MTVTRRLLVLFLGLLVIAGCARETMAPQDTVPEGDGTSARVTGHPQWYTLGWTWDPPRLQRIDTRTGRGTLLATIDATYGGTFGLAFDLDGSCYAMMGGYQGGNASVLTRIDLETGAVTPVNLNQVYPYIFAGPGIDRNGIMYVTGFTVGPPEYPDSMSWWGGYDLWRINKATGQPELVGDTRVGVDPWFAGRWMDLAFDSQNRLWTTCSNKLFLLDTTDGHATFVVDITGVPQDNIPGDTCPEDWPYIEVMDIAFDEHDVLWASAIRGFSWCTGTINAPVMTIDTVTGAATLVGYTEDNAQNHGGDIIPSEVTVAHRKPDGQFVQIVIPMDALKAHLAHGDYVPGTVGDPNYPR